MKTRKIIGTTFKLIVGIGIGDRLGRLVLGAIDKGAEIILEKLEAKLDKEDPEFKIHEKKEKK